jgi:hypothetical protein
MAKKDDIEFEIQETVQEPAAVDRPATPQESDEEVSFKEEAADMKEQAKKAIQMIKEKASEEDPKLTSALTLRTILGGDFLTADMVRRQVWLITLMVVFCIAYVAIRYQCQQDLLTIDKLEKELLDAKYKALTSSSTLTEKCRESHVLDALKQNKDSLLHVADQPPYIINIPE